MNHSTYLITSLIFVRLHFLLAADTKRIHTLWAWFSSQLGYLCIIEIPFPLNTIRCLIGRYTIFILLIIFLHQHNYGIRISMSKATVYAFLLFLKLPFLLLRKINWNKTRIYYTHDNFHFIDFRWYSDLCRPTGNRKSK